MSTFVKVSALIIALASLELSGCNQQQINNKTVNKAKQTSLAAAKQNNVAKRNLIKGKAAKLAPYSQRKITDEVFYFVLPDRFYNGDKSNDLGAKLADKKRSISRGGFDKTNKGMFHGGDLKGLIAKLPYLDNMGITAIWLTPILRNKAVQSGSAGYHGYWIVDFTEVDPHFGNAADLKQFIKLAHQRNIKVFFDIIANHTADVIKYKECHGNDGLGWIITSKKQTSSHNCPYKSLAQLAKGDHYTPVIPKGDAHLKYPEWLNNPKYYHNQGDSTWVGESAQNGDFAGLDDLKTEDPFVVKGMIKIYENLIDQYKPDGFRIDTVKHVNIDFWSQFAPALVSHAKNQGINNFFMFGEVYSADPAYLSQFVTRGKLQSVLDFGFQQAVVDTLINQQGTNKLAQLFAQDSLYNAPDIANKHNANNLVTFIGNHDMGRFTYMLNKSDYHYTKPAQIARLKLASALMFFSRGVPVIYYGDEQGFVGDGGDQDARQDMMPSLVKSYNDDDLLANTKTTANDNFDKTSVFYRYYQHLTHLYQAFPVLRNGIQTTLYSQETPGIFAFKRHLKNSEVIVVINTATTNKNTDFTLNNGIYSLVTQDGNGSYNLDTHGGKIQNKLTVNHNKASITLAPLSFVIYYKKS